MSRLDELTKKCAFMHAPEDIVEHLEEECIELLMAIKRWKRGKGPLRDVIDESCDVMSEIPTFHELILQYNLTTKNEIKEIREEKLNKYEAMLKLEDEKGLFTMINRYKVYLIEFINGVKSKFN